MAERMMDRTMGHPMGQYSERPGGFTTVNHPSEGIAQPHAPDAIDTTLGSLEHAIEQINSASYRVGRLADRIVGSTPTPMPGEKQSRPANPPLQILMGDLGMAIGQLFTQLERLNDHR